MGQILDFKGAGKTTGAKISVFTACGLFSGTVSEWIDGGFELTQVVWRPAGEIRICVHMDTVTLYVENIIGVRPYTELSFS